MASLETQGGRRSGHHTRSASANRIDSHLAGPPVTGHGVDPIRVP
jgi:hypothetical protein